MSEFLPFFTVTVSVLANCDTKENVSTNGDTTVVINNQKTDASPNKSPMVEATASIIATGGDKIDVVECDEYVAEIEACLFNKVPKTSRRMYQPPFEQMKKSRKDAAATQQGKAALASGCKQALETAKQSYAAFGCEF